MNMLRFFIIGFILVASFSIFNNIGDGVAGWFGKSKADLIEDNTKKDIEIEKITDINKEIIEDAKIIEDINDNQISEIVDLHDNKKKIDKKTDKSVSDIKDKAEKIKNLEIEEAKKDRMQAEIVIDSIWDGHCQITKC